VAPETHSRALVPYGFWEHSLLHPVQLMPAKRRGKRWPLVVLAVIVAVVGLAVGYVSQFGPDAAPLGRSIAAASAAGPDTGFRTLAQTTSAATPATSGVPFVICYSNAVWSPPDDATQAAHLQADPRYRTVDPARVSPERVHPELGPFRSASALGDFIALSGLWSDPRVLDLGCPADLVGRAELWGLRLRFQRFEVSGSDLTATTLAQLSGVEVVQLTLPPKAEALHVVDDHGAKLAPDIHLAR
jgi:hypothetical protein